MAEFESAVSNNPFERHSDPNNPFTRNRSPLTAPGQQLPRSTPTESNTSPSSGRNPGPGVANFDLEDLESLQWRVLSVCDAINSAEAEASPSSRTSKTDRTGSVTVTLGADGLPEALQVTPDWEQKVQPQKFAAAIGEAANAAMMAQMNTKAENLLHARGQGQDSVTLPGLPQPVRRDKPRPLDVLVEDALRLFAEAEQFRPAQPAQGTGRAAEGRFSVTLVDGGGITCSADPRWVSGKSPTMLAEAFRQAVSEARSSLAGTRSYGASSPGSPTAELQEVFGEAMSLLQDPSKLTDM